MLGIGTGESLNDVPAVGIAWPEFRERFARLREAVTLMRRLWSDDRVTYQGTYYKTAQEKVHVEDPLEMERLADALPTERTATRWIVSTDPEEHVQRIRFYTDFGFNHLVFHAPGTDQRRLLDLYAERVMPLLRKVDVQLAHATGARHL